MNMYKKTFKPAAIATMLTAVSLLSACGSDGDSAELAKAVELEKQRQNGTIIEVVTINSGQTRIKKGETHQLTATGLDSNGDTRDITSEITWSSSDTSIATVSSKGLVTGVANSDVNQGIITITGTTINDITGDAEVSVSDVSASSVALKQSFPESGNIFTCIDASITGDVTYADGYVSLNTVYNIDFSIPASNTANITDTGTLYTSSASIETISVTGKIDTVSDELTVIADPSNLEDIDILLNDEQVTNIITINTGQRVQFNSQATLLPEISTKEYDIDNSVNWQERELALIGVTNLGENKGTIVGLENGVTILQANCGGKEATATIEVKGDNTLTEMKINDGDDVINIAKGGDVELKLVAHYDEDSSISSLNVSEFANWSLNGSSLATAEIIDHGTNQASLKVTAADDVTGEFIVSAVYDDITTTVKIVIQ